MRARNVKPGLLQNELLGSADPLLTILFVGLWMMADREGRLEDKPLKITALAFPYRRQVTERKLDSMLNWMHEHGFIVRYISDEGEKFIQVVEFLKHQRPHSNEVPSLIPPLTLPDALPRSATEVNQGEKDFALIPDTGFLIPDTSPLANPLTPFRGGSTGHPGEREGDQIRRVFAHWQTVHGHPTSRLDDKRRTKIRLRLKEGYTVEQLCQAIDGYLKSPFHMGQNAGHKVYDALELMLRDAQHVDQGIGYLTQPAPVAPAPEPPKPIWR